VTCLTTPSTIYPEGDASGYTVELAAYGRDDLGILLQHAADLFAQHGLGRPVVFRAGGWTVDLSSLLALVDNGYVVDGSAINWSRIEEWQGKDLYTWTMTHWASIGDTSQPYWPSRADILSSTPAPDLPLLEVPDNGVMIDYVTNDEMTSIFDANWDGNALAAPRTLVMGFHPAPQMSYDEYKRVQHLLGLADMHLATRDLGPVVYTTMKDVVPAFAMP
jgi:hypothetical protein